MSTQQDSPFFTDLGGDLGKFQTSFTDACNFSFARCFNGSLLLPGLNATAWHTWTGSAFTAGTCSAGKGQWPGGQIRLIFV